MKKAFIYVCLILSVLLCSCASSKVEVKDSWGPVAIMSVSFNDFIGWEGDSDNDGGLLKVAAKKGIDSLGNENVQNVLGFTRPLFEDAQSALKTVFEEDLGMEVINEKILLNLIPYKEGKTSMAREVAFVFPEGYRAYTPKNKVAKEIKPVIGSNCFAYVNFTVAKHMCNGIGKTGDMTGSVAVVITLADEKGKTLATYNGYSSCFEKIPVVKSIYNKQELQNMYPEVFYYAILDAFFN